MAGKTTLTEKTKKIILALYKDGIQWQTIAQSVGVSEPTVLKWRNENVLGIYDDMERIRREKLLAKAEKTMEDLLESEDDHVKAKMSQFLGETLGKLHYSKQNDTVVNVIMPTPILDLGKLVATIPEKPLLNKES
jgi:transposase